MGWFRRALGLEPKEELAETKALEKREEEFIKTLKILENGFGQIKKRLAQLSMIETQDYDFYQKNLDEIEPRLAHIEQVWGSGKDKNLQAVRTLFAESSKHAAAYAAAVEKGDTKAAKGHRHNMKASLEALENQIDRLVALFTTLRKKEAEALNTLLSEDAELESSVKILRGEA